MEKSDKRRRLRYYLKLVVWVLIVQLVLANISASIYAYKFTHIYEGEQRAVSRFGFLGKTWRLFAGPSFTKDTTLAEPPFAYTTSKINTNDGEILDAWYSSVDSLKSCVIFFHGFLSNKSSLASEAAFFLRKGYNVLLVDFRAHGRSSGNTTLFGQKETADVKAAFDFARNKGNANILLYGASLGAGVCLKAAGEGIVQPKAIIADMPFGKLRDHLQVRAQELGFPSEPFASMVTFWIRLERGYNGFKHNVAEYAKGVSCPVFIEWGAQDPYVRKSDVDAIYNNLSSAEKRLLIYPEGNHSSFLHHDPESWQKEMTAFLAAAN